MTNVVGVDPGKTGYSCLLSQNETSPFFFSSLVKEIDGEYDVPCMSALVNSWARTHFVRLVVIEHQAPRAHGPRGSVKEGTVSSWQNGYGFGLWEASLVAAGFTRARDEEDARRRALEVFCEPVYLIVDPLRWKSAMGCLATGLRGEDTHAARRKVANEATIRAARRVDPATDFRALERTPGARTPSPDKSAARLLAEWGLRGVLGVRREGA